MEKKMEIVEEMSNYNIVKYYANTLYTNNDKENGSPYYGDIYLTKEDVLKDHPEAEVLEGFGFVDKKTGVQPSDNDTPDWFHTIDDVVEYVKGL